MIFSKVKHIFRKYSSFQVPSISKKHVLSNCTFEYDTFALHYICYQNDIYIRSIDIFSMLNFLKISIPIKKVSKKPHSVVLMDIDKIITTRMIKKEYINNSFINIASINKLTNITDEYFIKFLEWINDESSEIIESFRYIKNYSDCDCLFIVSTCNDKYLIVVTNNIYSEIFESNKSFNYNNIIYCIKTNECIISYLKENLSDKLVNKNKYSVSNTLLNNIIKDINLITL